MTKPSWWKAELTLTGLAQLAGGLLVAASMWFTMDKRVTLVEEREMQLRLLGERTAASQLEVMQTLARVVAILDERKQ